MKTVNGILNLIQEYGSECNDSYYSKSTAARLKILRTAIEELHKDAARLEWAMHYIPGSAWRHVGVNYNAGCTREDIDAAIDAAKEST